MKNRLNTLIYLNNLYLNTSLMHLNIYNLSSFMGIKKVNFLNIRFLGVD